jgi:hypothetical protein
MSTFPNLSELEHKHGVRWCQLAELEPRVHQLLWRAREAGAACRRWSDLAQLFSPLRNDLSGLIGFSGRHSQHPVLGSQGAYEVAYWKLYEAVAGLLPRVAEAVAETAPTEPVTVAPHSDSSSDVRLAMAGNMAAKRIQFAGIS